MVRVHRSGKKYEFRASIKSRGRRVKDSVAVAHVFPPSPSQSPANSLTVNQTHGPVTVIRLPMHLYLRVMDALNLIKSDTNPSDKYLQVAISRVHKVTALYTWCLPPDWKFNPATATQFEWQPMSEDDYPPISIKEKPVQKRKFDPNIELPKIYQVYLNKEQPEVWLKFKKSDKKTRTIHGIDLANLKATAKPIMVKHPVVSLIGNFAVDGFNKAFEMHVKKEMHNYLQQHEITECSYHKRTSTYWFHLTIEAVEEGLCGGVYESKVEISHNDDRITLCRFIRIDETPEVEEATHEEDGWSDPEEYYCTGLVCRSYRKGYDFYNPFGMDRHW